MTELCEHCFELMQEDAIECEHCGKKTPEGEKIEAERLQGWRETFETGVKPTLILGDLWGPDGNAFVVMGRVTGALKKMGASKQLCEAVTKKLKSGSYVQLLRTAETMFKLDVSGYDDIEEFLEEYEKGRPDDGDESAEDEAGFPAAAAEAYLKKIEEVI
jgi:hypothetical protein